MAPLSRASKCSRSALLKPWASCRWAWIALVSLRFSSHWYKPCSASSRERRRALLGAALGSDLATGLAPASSAGLPAGLLLSGASLIVVLVFIRFLAAQRIQRGDQV